MSNKNQNNPWATDKNFEPFDQYQHAHDLEEKDVFNILVEDAPRGGLRNKLQQLVASQNPADVAALRAAGIDSPLTPQIFHLSDGSTGKVFADATGTWHAVVTIAGEQLDFSEDDRDSVMVRAQQHLAKNLGPRDLTETEKLRIARLTQSGGTAEACELYVALRLDGKDRRSEREILEDPKYRELLDDAAKTIWRYSRPDYVFDHEFEDLLARASEMRPLTVRVVDVLYDKFQDQKFETARSTRRAAQSPEPETEHIPNQAEVLGELENLSDSAIEKLRTQTMRHIGHATRKFDNQMFGR